MLRLAFVMCLLGATPLAQGRRTRPRSETPNDTMEVPTAIEPVQEATPSTSSDGKEETLTKDTVIGTQPDKEDEEPSYYDPSKEGLCPKIVPHTDGGSIPSMVIVTIKNAQHLPWSYLDHPDSYVEFWTGEEGARQYYLTKTLLPGKKTESYWRARTQSYNNDTSPLWDWSCLLVYDVANPTITFQVWDRDLLTDSDFVGKATGNLLELIENEDLLGHGDFDVKFRISDNKGEFLKDRDGQQSTLTVNFEMVREKALYNLNRMKGHAKAHLAAHREYY